MKRPAGLKLLLSTVRESFPNHLDPFHGLFGYSSAVDKFEGTIFRLPIRAGKSLLSPSLHSIDSLRSELMSYFKEARISLLFIRQIHLINFSEFSGEIAKRWSVEYATRLDDATSSCEVVFNSSFLQLSWTDSYWIENDDQPDVTSEDVTLPWKMKNVQIGLAALLDSKLIGQTSELVPDTVNDSRLPEPRIFTRLPLALSSDIPVHINATFILSGDRKALIIAQDSSEKAASTWNTNLLTIHLPKLYLNLLQNIAAHYTFSHSDNYFDVWPSKQAAQGSPGDLVTTAFWRLLKSSNCALFPRSRAATAQRAKLAKSVAMKDCVFDFRPKSKDNDRLHHFFKSFVRNLGERPTTSVVDRLRPLSVKSLSSNLMQQQFSGPRKGVEFLQKLLGFPLSSDSGTADETRLLSQIYKVILPSNDDHQANDCQIVPLMDHTLGTLFLKKSSPGIQTYYVASPEQLTMFPFAAGLLVCGKFNDLFKDLASKETYNLKRLGLGDIANLLKSMTVPDEASEMEDNWRRNFWKMVNDADLSLVPEQPTLSSLSKYRLQISMCRGKTSYRSFEEINACAAVIAPIDSDEQLEFCESISGLHLIDASTVPSAVQRCENNLTGLQGFQRFVQSVARLAKSQNISIAQMIENIDRTDVSLIRSDQMTPCTNFISITNLSRSYEE